MPAVIVMLLAPLLLPLLPFVDVVVVCCCCGLLRLLMTSDNNVERLPLINSLQTGKQKDFSDSRNRSWQSPAFSVITLAKLQVRACPCMSVHIRAYPCKSVHVSAAQFSWRCLINIWLPNDDDIYWVGTTCNLHGFPPSFTYISLCVIKDVFPLHDVT